MNVNAVLALLAIGAVLGALLGFANKYLHVEEDERITVVTEKLPGANCGGCGYPGCAGFAAALVEGTVTKVSGCVVANAEIKADVAKYLNETPGPDGTTLKVTA